MAISITLEKQFSELSIKIACLLLITSEGKLCKNLGQSLLTEVEQALCFLEKLPKEIGRIFAWQNILNGSY